MQKFLALFVALALAIPAMALAGVFYNNPLSYQDHPRDLMANAWLVRVKPGPNASFYWNGIFPGCPANTSVCRQKSYLVPGDIGVASYTTGAFTVVEFVGPRGPPADGAIESRLLERLSTPPPTIHDWIGHWQSSVDDDIVISRTSSPFVLAFAGNATWGASDPERVKRGGVHIGAFGAYVKPTAEWGGFTDELGEYHDISKFPPITAQKGLDQDWAQFFPKDTQASACQASFRLLGPYLLTYTPVDSCGGLNVSFTGVYRRILRRHG